MVSRKCIIILLISNIIGFTLGLAAAIVFYFIHANEPAVVLSILVTLCASLNIYIHLKAWREELYIYTPGQLSSMSFFGFLSGMVVLWLLLINVLKSYSTYKSYWFQVIYNFLSGAKVFLESDIIVDVWLFILMKHLFMLFFATKKYSRMLIVASRPLLSD